MAAKHFTSRAWNVSWLWLMRCIVFIGMVSLSRACLGQTNLTAPTVVWTNSSVYRLVTPSDFQRLHYYYLAQTNSPGPGTEHHVFTLGPKATWNNDWNSAVVPQPTRKQLNAISAQQVDLFRRAGTFTNGTWQVITSLTNIPLSSLKLSASSYTWVRAAVDHDQLLRQIAQIERSSGGTSETSNVTPVASPP